ncbi:hypothetical protein FY528_08995 [Hymenobacter lutimineralis]|uniref:Uncharacterized protein n=1 Tax=Hymenobacter lutimineralis TaxID=2606448 RepID=A0A5D6V6P0_9BACT|nr:hypothetical protein [Hymenobacter lutimineralis]TYZ10588.1 hypothetical protein FY528_08995 [Hymenobacter lutimineralis]
MARSITLTDPDDGTVYHGQLPTGWHEVRVSMFQEFARLQAGRRPELARLSALQALTNLPADVLEADASLAPALAALYLPWFFAELPTGEPAPTLQHRGVTYEYVGDWSRLTAGQFEALLTFLDEANGNPGLAAPHLLAVLLVAKGRTQDAKAVEEASAVFTRLSMEQAWPYVANFLKHSSPAALAERYPALFKEAAADTTEPGFSASSSFSFTHALLWHSRHIQQPVRLLRKWQADELLEDMAFEYQRTKKDAKQP